MSKKIFISTIPLQPKPLNKEACDKCGRPYTGGLKKVSYSYGYTGNGSSLIKTRETSFPIIPTIEDYFIPKEDEIEIILIKTLDTEGNTDYNYNLFMEELSVLGEDLNCRFPEPKIIEIDHNENPVKQVKLLRKLSECYEDNAEVFMDITFGTKATEVAMFASLAYAETICGCEVRNVCYGKINHDTRESELYDVRSLYDLNSIINGARFVKKENAREVINILWGENDEL